MAENDNAKMKMALTLALIVATSWAEDDRREPGRKIVRAWKGYQYELLDTLEQLGMIRSSVGARSMQVTTKGAAEGARLFGLIAATLDGCVDLK